MDIEVMRTLEQLALSIIIVEEETFFHNEESRRKKDPLLAL